MTNVYRIENLEDLLQCSICLDRYQVPKVLSCQHTFCLRCLQGTYNTANRTLTCPTCRGVMLLKRGPDELPSNLLLINLMDVKPMKAKCPCCNLVETLTICPHCHCTKCKNCNDKHIQDIRDSAKNALSKLEDTDRTHLKASINSAFKKIRHEIADEFQRIRQQHDSVLLSKQMAILQQLDLHERDLLTHVEGDLQLLERAKSELTGKDYHLDSKSEPELIDLLNKVSELQSALADKLAEHEKQINTTEISLQYDPARLAQVNQIADHLQLSLTHTAEDASPQPTTLAAPSDSVIGITLRTFLNQEYKCRIPLDQTVSDLKQAFAKQENLDPQWIVLTKQGNFFQELDDNRTLKSYGCDASAVLMVCIRR